MLPSLGFVIPMDKRCNQSTGCDDGCPPMRDFEDTILLSNRLQQLASMKQSSGFCSKGINFLNITLGNPIWPFLVYLLNFWGFVSLWTKKKRDSKQTNKQTLELHKFVKNNGPSKVVATTQKGHPFGSPFRHTTPTLRSFRNPAKRKPVGVCLSTIMFQGIYVITSQVVCCLGFQPLAT